MFEFLGQSSGDFVQLQIFVGFQIGMVFLFNLLRRMRKEVVSFKEYMTLVNLQYQQAERIIQNMDDDPNTESKMEKVFRYIGKQLETISDVVHVDENEFMTEEQKIQSFQNKIVDKVQFVIKEYEGDDSDLLNDKLILDTVNFVLKFLSPLLFKK